MTLSTPLEFLADDSIVIASSLSSVDPCAWNRLAGDQATLQHAYLYGLETTACVGRATGWQPQHLLRYHQGQLRGAMPLYLKSHSRGEYVFDHGWAHAFMRAGLAYYPKLVCAVPFTPVPGKRVLGQETKDQHALIRAALRLAQHSGLSSLHVLFPCPADLALLKEHGLLERHNIQFHWKNQSYTDMAQFLKHMTQRHRKRIRQSRRHLQTQDITFDWHEGRNISDDVLDFFYRCYCQTYMEHGNAPYLSRDFFFQLREQLSQHIVIVTASQNQQPIASAFFLRDRTRLYGRYWGGLKYIPGLHFETCYLQGIEYSITHKLDAFEGGAQGEHKIARGLLPVTTYSAHWLADPRFADAIDDVLIDERSAIAQYGRVLHDHSPFRN